MRKVYLIDEDRCQTGGHNANYRNALSSIEGTEIYDCTCDFPSMSRSPIKGYTIRKKYFDTVPRGGAACLLHLDTIYMAPSVIRNIKRTHEKVVGVLHWYPNNRLKVAMLQMSAKHIDVIVVHSEYIKEQLAGIGVSNVTVIDYPLFCSIDLNALKTKKHWKKTFLCLGGSRIDKGHDILAESFQYIPIEARKNISIVIAGKEIDVPYSLIKQKADEAGIDISFINKRLAEDEYWQLIMDSDVIMLPYKRVFTGNSGPMTDGVSLNKYILGPDEGNLGYLINRYQLGSTFKIEDPQSLGKEIAIVSHLNTTCEHEYRKMLDKAQFIKSYKELFEKL